MADQARARARDGALRQPQATLSGRPVVLQAPLSR